MHNKTKASNKLITEKSPYLLQHAYNPVNWFPWSEEAFEKARTEDKPIFLSIGYSTCHWCHVMEYESFEDEEVSKLLNDSFISIKVDREERPDIDNIYMAVCQMMTGSGGWPLTVIMTPEKKPFFTGTYYPKNSRYGRIGMLELILKLDDVWKNQRKEVINSAASIVEHLKEFANKITTDLIPDLNILDLAFEMFTQRFDSKYGGFGSAPKFPTPHNLLFLLRYWKRTKNKQALLMVENTLQAISQGGIYDHLGYGFHRYSTDSYWLVPHFEKMLYDQAMLLMAFTETYQITQNTEYKKIVEEIITYVSRDLKDKQGGFYCAEDADSEGVEGKFYVWTKDEVKNILNPEESELIIKTFNITEEGNYFEESTKAKTGENIFHLTQPRSNDSDVLKNAKQKLFQVRGNRIHPHKDKKILTSWNGLMIAALAKAYSVFEDEHYLIAAKNACEFISKHITNNETLLHSYCDGEAKVTANLDDYSFLIWGLLELYEATFEDKYLEFATDFSKNLLENFWDEKNGGFYFTPSFGEELLVRQKEIYDGAIPSGNSVSILNLLKLSKLTGDKSFESYAVNGLKAFSSEIKSAPIAYTQLLNALDFYIGPSHEIVIVGDENLEDTKKMISVGRKAFIPNKVLILDSEGKQFPGIGGKTTAYVCQNFSCKNPVTKIDELLKILD